MGRAGDPAMRLGIVSDIHCNAAGLAEALRLMGEIDELICLGDSIWEYRFSNEVVGTLRERGAHTILGNHEEGFLGPQGERGGRDHRLCGRPRMSVGPLYFEDYRPGRVFAGGALAVSEAEILEFAGRYDPQ